MSRLQGIPAARLVCGALRRLNVALRQLDPSQRRLAAAHPDQRDRFARVASLFSQHYAGVRPYPTHSFITPFWQEMNDHLERVLLPRPPFGFLNDATIESLMFRSVDERSSFAELRHLEGAYAADRLRSIVAEDHVGRPPIAHAKYLASVNTVHQLFLLDRFLRSTMTDLDAIRSVVEWGGGFGAFAKVLLRARNAPVTYVLLDTPLIACVQWLYLSVIFGPDRVHLLRRPTDKIVPMAINVASVAFVDQIAGDVDLFVSSFALSESSAEAQRYVTARDWFGARNLLLVFQKPTSATHFRGADLASAAQAAGARIETGEMHPNDFYAFR